ncbi:hypothetical protein C0995_014128, partial [Termitomyces sp. Mi166
MSSNVSTRYNLRLRPTAMHSAGQVSRTGDSVSSAPRAAPPQVPISADQAGARRGQDQSSGAPEKTTAPADSSLTAPANDSDSAQAESSLTELESEKASQVALEEIARDLDSSSSDNEDVVTGNKMYDSPMCDSDILQERISVAREGPRRRARTETTYENCVEGLSREQSKAFEQARNNLTNEQRELVDARQRNIRFGTPGQSADTGGQARTKGKGPDPRNWGEANLSGDELDPDAQRQILEACNDQRDNPVRSDNEMADREVRTHEDDGSDIEDTAAPTREELRERLWLKRELEKDIRKLQKELKKSEKRKKHAKRAGSEPISNELQDMINQVTQRARGVNRQEIKGGSKQKLKPINQVTKDSALGRAFGRIRSEGGSDPSSSSSSESSESSSSDSEDSSYLSTGSSDGSESVDSLSSSSDEDRHKQGGSRKRKSPKRKSSNRKHSKIPKSLIKPTPPAKYDRTPDLQAFLQFMTHCASYVKYGLVQKERHVLVVSEFLTARAWTFYSREVLHAPEEWPLERFFRELFNECFPINYRNKQRNKLHNLWQGKMTVRDYVGELQELFT